MPHGNFRRETELDSRNMSGTATAEMGKSVDLPHRAIKRYYVALGMSRTQLRRLIQRNLLRQQAVQNPEPCLFFRSQCHILHGLHVTFLLAS